MKLYISRHGQSIYNILKKIGGNSSLSDNGKLYANKLANYFNNFNDLTIYTSELKRTNQTCNDIKFKKNIYSCLNEINAGICDGLTYKEIEEKYPDIHNNRLKDKLNYRYPEGESYIDLINKIKPFIEKIKNKNEENILIVGHQAVLRVIFGLLYNISYEKIPYLSIKLHLLKELIIDNNFMIVKENNIEF